VAVIIEHLASGSPWESVLQGYPELEREDISAALFYAGWVLDNPGFGLSGD